jgi:hypothetical protein
MNQSLIMPINFVPSNFTHDTHLTHLLQAAFGILRVRNMCTQYIYIYTYIHIQA